MKTHIDSLRNEDRSKCIFEIFEEVQKAGEKFVDEPDLPRRNRVPRRFDSGSAAHQWKTPEEYFHSQFFCTVDLLVAEIDRRFDQYTLRILTSIEKLLLQSFVADTEVDIPEEIAELYRKDRSVKRLAAQLCMFPDLLQAYNKKQSVPVSSVTTISTVYEVMSKEKTTKDMFSQVHKLLKIYLTIPMSNTTAESLSVLRRLKTCLSVIQ